MRIDKILNKRLIPVLFAAALIGSCDDRLDLAPEDSLTSDVVFSSKFAAQGAVTGLYAQAREVAAMNGNDYVYEGVMSDELEWTGSFPTIVDINIYEVQAPNGSTAAFWQEGYDLINLANFVLDKVPAMDEAIITQAEKNQLLGEASFMRAMMYFKLVNLYAQPYSLANGSSPGLPLVVMPFDDDAVVEEFQLPRSTVNEVHGLIASDLQNAIDLLPDNAENSRATQGAAKALKARLHLYRGEWQPAATLANEVIESGTFTLATDYTFWNSESTEHIFFINNNAVDGTFGGTGLHNFAVPAPAGRGDAFLSEDLLATFEPGDLRLEDPNNTIDGDNTNQVTKTFSNKVPSAQGDADMPVLRITEMYYIRAEANLRGGLSIGDTPENDINRLRARAGLAPLGTVTLDDILEERRKEFFLEGHRRADLLRNQRDLRPVGNPQFTQATFGADRTIFPVPARERENNPNIEQNPGY
ncbi:RagB/SusD family nutrient uptake outer membrane protein [Maribacter sp. 2307ULW6-5]|uniref:RagB/SusD family nutrient uptake outer membrane protein n=1 Tax=Maribacter sp. 2307ULW6-5 TaxID=3386275 RepID=UPI0039BD37CF